MKTLVLAGVLGTNLSLFQIPAKVNGSVIRRLLFLKSPANFAKG